MSQEAKWYVVHTYSGYENKVKATLEKSIENNNLGHLFFDIKLPMEEVIEVKDSVQKSVMKKMLPGYVIIKMIMTDFSWYIVRNTRGVTGFVGPGSKPVPLTEAEIERLGFEQKSYAFNFKIGDNVQITADAFKDYVGIVEDIDTENQKVKVSVFVMGNETSIDFDFGEVEPIED